MRHQERSTTGVRHLIGSSELIRAAIGALSGAIGGFGAAIVLVQGGQVGISASHAIAWGPVVLGAALGFIKPSPWMARAMVVLVTVGAGFVFLRGAGAPVSAAGTEACTMHVTVSGTTTDVAATTRSAPLVLDVDEPQTIDFHVDAPTIERGFVEVTVVSVAPFGSWIDVGDSVVYFDDVAGGVADGRVELDGMSMGRFRISGDGWTTTGPALGVMELDARVVRHTGGALDEVCRQTLWIRAVASPAGNALGRVGLGMTAAGALGLLLAGPLWELTPFGRARRSGRAGRARAFESPPVLTDACLVDGEGRQLGTGDRLIVERSYRLMVSLSAGIDERDDGGPADGEVSVRARGALVGPKLSVSLFGAPLSFDIRPTRPGQLDVVIEYSTADRAVVIGRVRRDVSLGDADPVAGVEPAPNPWAPPVVASDSGSER